MNKKLFLKDVFICSLGAYGGPEAHYAVFSDQMVHKKKYLSDEELLDFMALCSVLPGPTSTQTIVSIGYKVGGPVLALLTMLVWALPVITVMIFLSFFIFSIQDKIGDKNFLEYIGPMAVGFIVVAAYRISKSSTQQIDGYTVDVISPCNLFYSNAMDLSHSFSLRRFAFNMV